MYILLPLTLENRGSYNQENKGEGAENSGIDDPNNPQDGSLNDVRNDLRANFQDVPQLRHNGLFFEVPDIGVYPVSNVQLERCMAISPSCDYSDYLMDFCTKLVNIAVKFCTKRVNGFREGFGEGGRDRAMESILLKSRPTNRQKIRPWFNLIKMERIAVDKILSFLSDIGSGSADEILESWEVVLGPIAVAYWEQCGG